MDNRIYKITNITDHDGKQKPYRIGRRVRFGRPVLPGVSMYFENVEDFLHSFVTSPILDSHRFRFIMDGRLSYIVITENSVYYLEEEKQ